MAQQLANEIAGSFKRTKSGRLIIPAGELCDTRLHVPEDDLPEALLASRAGRRWMASRSVPFFSAYHLGISLYEHQIRWIAEVHANRRHLQEAPRDHGKSFALGYVDVTWRIAMSATCIGPSGEAVPGLREDLAPANIRILLTTRGGGNAVKRMVSIRNTLEAREELLADFGPFQTARGKWTDALLDCRRNKRGLHLSDPTVEVVSVGSAVTGGRLDHALLDDVEDRASTNTESQRAKGREDLGNVLELLEEDGTAAAIGTRKHADDYYARLERNPVWHVSIDRAFIRWPGGTIERDETKWKPRTNRIAISEDDPTRGYVDQIDGFERIDPGAVVLCEAKWPTEKLLLKFEEVKAQAGSWYFEREQQQNCVDPSSALLKPSWFQAAKDKGRKLRLMVSHRYEHQRVIRQPGPGRRALPPGLRKWLTNPFWREGTPERERLLIFASGDLSLVDEAGKLLERDNDYTALWIWGLNWETKQRILLDCFRARWISEGGITDAITGTADAWQPIEFAIEKNAFQKLIISHLRRTTDLPIHGHYTGSNKHDPFHGLPALAGLLETRDGDPESGRLVLPYSPEPENQHGRELIDILVAEGIGLGTEPHDDLLMSLWIGHSLITRWIDMMEDRIRKGIARVAAEGEEATKPKKRTPKPPKRPDPMRSRGRSRMG